MRFKKGIDIASQAITAGLMIIMAALTLLQLTSRYFFASLSWTEELARMDFIYLTFFGSIVASQRREHLKIEVLEYVLPPGMRKWHAVIIDLASALVLGVVVWQGFPLLEKFWPVHSAALEWPTTVFYFPVVFGCFVMLIYTVLDVVAVVRHTEDREKTDSAQEVSQ